jgi:hypothetical protein
MRVMPFLSAGLQVGQAEAVPGTAVPAAAICPASQSATSAGADSRQQNPSHPGGTMLV